MLYNEPRLLTSRLSLCAYDHAGVAMTYVPVLPEPLTHGGSVMVMSQQGMRLFSMSETSVSDMYTRQESGPKTYW